MTIPNPLSEKTTAEIEALSRKISVAEELDGEIQAELRGHIEDKVRGYVSGAVKVLEADAMLLAKAHFGDAAVIKGMFQGVHAKAHGVSLARRLAAVFIVTVGIWAVMSVTEIFWQIIGNFLRALAASVVASDSAPTKSSYFLDLFFKLVLITATSLLFWKVLASWRKRMDQGKRIWFEKWSPITLAIIAVISVVCYAALIEFSLGILKQVPVSAPNNISFAWKVVAYIVFPSAQFLAQAFLWLWWCDRAPRTLRAVIVTGLSWLITYEFLVATEICASFVVLAIERSSPNFLMLVPYRFTGHILLVNLAFDLPLLLAAFWIYSFATRRRSILVVD